MKNKALGNNKTSKNKDNTELESGYTCDVQVIYYFEHIPTVEAEKIAEVREKIFVVETINWTLAQSNKKMVHKNKYFAISLTDAIAIAAKIEIFSQNVAENVVGIRQATPDEISNYYRVDDHYNKLALKAIE